MSRSPKMTTRERLVWNVQELERLEAAKREAALELQAAFADAKQDGFDPITLKVVLRLRRMTPEQRRERRALEAIYMAALGMLEGDALPDAARRRLDEAAPPPPPPAEAQAPEPPADGAEAPTSADEPPAVAEPEQVPLILKDPAEARQEGMDAAAAGKRIYDNPFPAGDPCRAAWDEGWCAQSKSHGMDTPAAFQRRAPKAPGKPDAEAKPDDAAPHDPPPPKDDKADGGSAGDDAKKGDG